MGNFGILGLRDCSARAARSKSTRGEAAKLPNPAFPQSRNPAIRMSYFAPGFREILRFLARTALRLRLLVARRQLAAAETRLGLLGWQQADFDPETQRQVDAIQNVEREQATLTNRAADLARDLAAVTAERDAVRAGFEKQRAVLEAERTSARAPLAEIERIVGTVRGRPADIARRIADLERELRETDALYTKLLGVNPQTPQVRDEIMRLRQRLIAIPNETSDIKAQQLRATADLEEREKQRAAIDRHTADLDRQLRELKAQAAERDAASATLSRALEKDHARAETDVARLERAKHDPYREIGRVLAESGVAPANQPHALTRVHDLWKAIAAHETALATSLAETAAEDASTLRTSLALCAVIALAALLVLSALL